MTDKRGSGLRGSLVFFQMFTFISLFIVAFIITGQVNYLKNKDLGFDKENILSIPLGISNADNSRIYHRLKNKLSKNPRIEQVTATFTHPRWFGTEGKEIQYNGRRLDKSVPINITSVDFDFLETMKIKILRGRGFSKNKGSEKGNLLVNESFEKLLGVNSAINQKLKIGASYEGKIVGVMQDFHTESITRAEISPLIIFYNPAINYIFVRLHPGDISKILHSLQQAWKEVAPNIPFKFNFLQQELEGLYVDLENLGKITEYFTLLAIIIASLGLFGLTSFFAEKRTREIGIRKILGSTLRQLLFLLCRTQVKLVFLATLLAWPFVWTIMNRWLEKFPYHININFWPFLLSGLMAFAVSFLTTGYHVLKASRTNPIEAIRHE